MRDKKHSGPAGGTTPTLLLVEDNDTDIFVIREALRASGLRFEIRLARDGEEALLYLDQVAGRGGAPCPALILLDLNLPKVGGVEVLRALRGSGRCGRTAVIVVTSSDSQVDRDTAEQLGAEAYFRKPNDLESYVKLADVIREVMSQA